ncbi:hypothetical protein ACQQ2Q_10630 [Agrobacterium sp. ES01]|uniref:hypothetical protein n=1 Tax=Agrobacterium sp. ES01 TaxID=3420714 RepID=UPI003D0D5CEC
MSDRTEDPGVRTAMPEFSQAERDYIFSVSASEERRSSLFGVVSAFAYYAPAIAIGAYGLWDGDFKVLGIGFLTLVASLVWGFAGEWGRRNALQTGVAIVVKLRRALEQPTSL